MRIIHLACALMLAACSASAGSRVPAARSEAERVVQARHDAFNRQDLDALLAVYAPDAVHRDHPADTVHRGVEEIHGRYREDFTLMSRVRVAVRERTAAGREVVDVLHYRGFPCGGTFTERVTYEVENGRIRTATSEPLSEYPSFSIVPGFHTPICPRFGRP